MVSAPDVRLPFALPANAILIAGPTAVGKSTLALNLARELGGEIVSVDSMQVYFGLDIGTAKPSKKEREQIRHHLIDIVDVTEPFDVARFVRLARKAVFDIQVRGRLPILCGGTGLYFKALLEGLGEAPPADPVLRAELETTPLPNLLRELASADPSMYERIDRQNARRVIRAIEVIRLTGKAYSAQRAQWQSSAEKRQGANFLGLTRSPVELNRRIDTRVEAMFQAGLVAETEAMLQRGLAQNRTALQALGYRQVAEYLRGERDLPQTIELVKIRTHQFAKRQRTWFKRQAQCDWIQLGSDLAADVAQIARHVKIKRNEPETA